MLKNQKDKFKIPDNIHYLNCAFMSPFLKEVEQIGHQAVSKKCFPYQITGNDFFADTNKLKKVFASLIEAEDHQNIAVIPSVSYGVANVANNILLGKDDEILVVDEQFPSNIYSWQKLADKYQGKVITAIAPKLQKGRGKKWNDNILELINHKTKVIAIPHVHWSDGTLFDLKAIRKKADMVNALLIIDGTQSVGALPFSVAEIKPDALICAGYKWLFGPYSIGLAYYSDKLCDGNPIEENWINRKNSEDFAGLVHYEAEYQPKAGRFNVGEMSNFTLTPMLLKAIEQIIAWQPKNIQQYTKEISIDAIVSLQNLGCFIESETARANHLFGVYLPENIDIETLKKDFAKNNIYVSFRGNAIRVAPHLYNDSKDFQKFVTCFKNAIKN
ncbi:MAG TPA: aminotransferase class V-fold PLP-dependent enzyme [Flavobacteriia bacterium]|jgi:selenocysteine lyase/cysteine desulfurase|nr:aminotransferase class V-fold PLP-dependent enzyme [Flavobacteriia bacterium]